MQALGRFIAASGFANLADGVATVAWTWIASLLTRDALLISLVPVALRLPWFLFALPAGIVTDRVDRRLLILRMDVLRGLAFAVAALALWLAMPLDPAPMAGVSSPQLFTALCLAALLVGTAEVFRDNAAQTMLPALVPPAGLERANGRLWSVEMVGNALIGPALGAWLIALWLPLGFALNAAAYALAVLLVLGLSGPFRPDPGAEARDWKRELRGGFAFLRHQPLLRALAGITGVWNLLHQMMMVALLLIAQERFGLGATGYGLLLAAGALGGIAGGLLGDRVVAAFGPARSAQWMLAASAPAFAAMALATNVWVMALVLAVFEFTGLVWNIVSVSYRQRRIPDALLGRVNSIYRLLAWGMMPLGLVLSGLLIRGGEALSGREAALNWPLWMAALGATALAFWGWRALGRGFSGDGDLPG